jgi:hypothetical protein
MPPRFGKFKTAENTQKYRKLPGANFPGHRAGIQAGNAGLAGERPSGAVYRLKLILASAGIKRKREA